MEHPGIQARLQAGNITPQKSNARTLFLFDLPPDPDGITCPQVLTYEGQKTLFEYDGKLFLIMFMNILGKCHVYGMPVDGKPID